MKTLKRIVAILLLALLTIHIYACSHDVRDTSSEETVNWQPNPSSDFEYSVDPGKKEIRIHKYIGSSKEVIIPSEIDNMSVVAIGGNPAEPTSSTYEGAFYNTGVETVVIPETVRTIGFASFADCTELTQVIFPKDSCLLSIARTAFYGCVNLEKIDLSSTKLIMIGEYVFKGCSDLKEIRFPDTLEQIGEWAFSECSSLVEVKLPSNVTKIGAHAFANCMSLERIHIPPKLNLYCSEGSPLNHVPALKQIVFDEGREEIVGYGLVQTGGNVEVMVPKGVKRFSSFTFIFFDSPSNVTVSFSGDVPEIVDGNEPAWLEGTVVFYDPDTVGWETFALKDRVEMKQS